MSWYTVIKRINGQSYLYLQMTYREGGKVKTKNKYLGAATSTRAFGSGRPSNLPKAPNKTTTVTTTSKPRSQRASILRHRIEPTELTTAAIARAQKAARELMRLQEIQARRSFRQKWLSKAGWKRRFKISKALKKVRIHEETFDGFDVKDPPAGMSERE